MSEINKDTISTAQNTRHFQIVVFKLGEEEYGLHIDHIKEVVITPVITRMPQTPSYIKGVANVRGNVIAILDLEDKFQLSRKDAGTLNQNNFTLVIESEDYKMGILVREVPNTLSISSDHIEQSVFVGGDRQNEQSYISGIAKLDKRLIVMIDIFKVISDPDTQQIFNRQTA